MRHVRRVVALAVVVVLTAMPAFASHNGIHPTFRTEDVYFTCPGPTKVQQANWALAIGNESSTPGWQTAPPSESVTDGAGCGSADWGGTTNVLYGPAFQGVVTGNLRDVTIRLHEFVTHAPRLGEPQTLRVNAELNGAPLFPPGAQPADGRTVTVTPTVLNDGVTQMYEFSITNLGFAEEVVDDDGNLIDVQTGGAVTEDGDGTRNRQLTIFVGLHGTALGQDPSGHSATTWVWDTTEVPSGITFNPPALAQATVAADLPR